MASAICLQLRLLMPLLQGGGGTKSRLRRQKAESHSQLSSGFFFYINVWESIMIGCASTRVDDFLSLLNTQSLVQSGSTQSGGWELV